MAIAKLASMTAMAGLFGHDILPQADRGAKSDRLVLPRVLEKLAKSQVISDNQLSASHEIVLKWADLESSGRLLTMNESQVEGDFVREVFGDALHYTRKTENTPEWHFESKRSFGQSTPDAVIGHFGRSEDAEPEVVVELKGPRVNLDRDRSAGRTPVRQLWDYLSEIPEARWGIATNIVSFRLYERNHTPRRYEHFALQDLRDINEFRRFYTLFERFGLIDKQLGYDPRADALLDDSDSEQREVSDRLYDYYSEERHRLIQHLIRDKGLELEEAIGAAQQLLDRVIFIAFCEDRRLLPDRTLARAFEKLPPFEKATNPKWRNFVRLFRAVDEGAPDLELDEGYNGGLFAESIVDQLDLDDRWTNFFRNIGEYNFRDEINLDVLGHLFERSITELEKLREGDLFGEGAADAERFAQMPQSAKRKRFGVYYTPPQLTLLIAQISLDELIEERARALAETHGGPAAAAESPAYWADALAMLRAIKVCDPACGSGAFLFQAYEILESRYAEILSHLPDSQSLAASIPDLILTENLYGVDLSPESVEIARLALWIRSAQHGRKLSDLSHNIRVGNSLIDDPASDPSAFRWREEFPEVFDREQSGFDCVIGNPPWERMKLQEREFFALSAPRIATATNAATRRRLIAELESENPELYARYIAAREHADRSLAFVRGSGRFPLTGKGDINTYAIFAELASQIVAPNGRVGLLVPSGIVSDKTTKDFFASLVDSNRLRVVRDFENKKGLFPDVHRSFKFSVFHFGGIETQCEKIDFSFYLHSVDQIQRRDRQITLTPADLARLNPNTKTCPVFRTRRDAEITKAIYRRIPVLWKRGREDGNPWGVRFLRMFDQTNDAELFHDAARLKRERFRRDGRLWKKGKREMLPLYEAKMVQMYDHRAASVIVTETNWMRQGQTDATALVDHQDPAFCPEPRFWVDRQECLAALDASDGEPAFVAFKDVTSPTNQRTMIASFVPFCGVLNSAPLMRLPESQSWHKRAALLANLNSFVYDFCARQKVGNVHLNFFIVEQLPTLPPHRYDEPCPWDPKRTLADWIAERVLKLSCTSRDMLSLAEAAAFSGGNLEDGRLHRWNEQERSKLMGELDAAFLLLYGVERQDAEYILSTFQGVTNPSPGLTGAGSTAELVLDVYDWLSAHSR